MSAMVLNKEDFIDKLSPDFEDNRPLVEALYNILFVAKLADLGEKKRSTLLKLLTNDASIQSKEILQAIQNQFPETNEYFQKISDYSTIPPKNLEGLSSQDIDRETLKNQEIQKKRIELVMGSRKALYDIFMSNGSIEEYLKDKFWNIYLDDLRASGDVHLSQIEKDISIVSVDRESNCISFHLAINTRATFVAFEGKQKMNEKKEYETIELSYLAKKFKSLVGSFGFKLAMRYTVQTGISDSNTKDVNTNKPEASVRLPKKLPYKSNSAEIPLADDLNRDNYYGDSKDKLLVLFGTNKNVYVGGFDESLGKTHLAHAVIKKYKEEYKKNHPGQPDMRIIYTTGIRFQQGYLQAIDLDRTNNTNFTEQNAYSSSFDADILVIDDFHLLTGDSTQNLLKNIKMRHSPQLILLSNVAQRDIRRVQKSVSQSMKGDQSVKESKFIPVDLSISLGGLSFLPLNNIDPKAKKSIIEGIWNEEAAKLGIFAFKKSIMAQDIIGKVKGAIEESVHPKMYRDMISSIILNGEFGEGQEINAEIIYNIMSKMCNTINIIPTKNDIVDITISEKDALIDIIANALRSKSQNNLSIKSIEEYSAQYVDKSSILNGSNLAADSLNGFILRLSVYFIKKYYPKDSMTIIGHHFRRGDVSSFNKEVGLREGIIRIQAMKSNQVTKSLFDYFKAAVDKRWKSRYGILPKI